MGSYQYTPDRLKRCREGIHDWTPVGAERCYQCGCDRDGKGGLLEAERQMQEWLKSIPMVRTPSILM